MGATADLVDFALRADPPPDILRAATRHLGKSDREAAGVLSSAQRHTHFLDSPRMSAVLGRSDFTFADVKARPTTVYLVLPPDRLLPRARELANMLAERGFVARVTGEYRVVNQRQDERQQGYQRFQTVQIRPE